MRETRKHWPLMSFYERFELVVAVILNLIVTLVIALIAQARKFVILDTTTTGAMTIAALAVATLVLGVVYWLLRERDDRLVGAKHFDINGS